jgi:hypothetical protein
VNFYAPTKAREVPMKMSTWMASRLRTSWKLAYIKLNSQTPCPPRGAVPVNQGYCGKFFHSQYPLRFRSWLRPPKLCPKSLASRPKQSKHFIRLFSQERSTANTSERPCRFVPKIATISRICRFCGQGHPSMHSRSMLQFPF